MTLMLTFRVGGGKRRLEAEGRLLENPRPQSPDVFRLPWRVGDQKIGRSFLADCS